MRQRQNGFFFQIELCLMHECATKEKIGVQNLCNFFLTDLLHLYFERSTLILTYFCITYFSSNMGFFTSKNQGFIKYKIIKKGNNLFKITLISQNQG